jgi:murein DD-endopeptidase MepM/ murein hydrolase activator NlpD
MTMEPKVATNEPLRARWPDWWIYLVLAAWLAQCALLMLVRMRPGLLRVVSWFFGSDLSLWLVVAVVLLLIGVTWSAWKRPLWGGWRVAGIVAAIALALSPMAYRTYPSSHDDAPSQVRFRLPLDGPVTVAWGGGTPDVNYHVVAPDQRWAYDLLVTRDGSSHRGDGTSVEDYNAYGLPVLAPADGKVVAVSDGDPDMPIGVMGGGRSAGGNEVVLEVAPGEFLFLCHMRPGSIAVKSCDQVSQGQVIGNVGNSGNTNEPHVHVHLQDSPDEDIAEGIPLYFHDYKVGDLFIERGIPTGGKEGGRSSSTSGGRRLDPMSRRWRELAGPGLAHPSIGALLALVGLLAMDCTAVRFVLGNEPMTINLEVGITAVLPMLNVMVMVVLQRSPLRGDRPSLPESLVAGTLACLAVFVACLMAPGDWLIEFDTAIYKALMCIGPYRSART